MINFKKILSECSNSLAEAFQEGREYRKYLSAIDNIIAGNFKKAFEQFDSLKKKTAITYYHLGCMLFLGNGAIKDHKLAVDCFNYAAVLIPQAMYALYKIYKGGTVGIPQNKINSLMFISVLAVEDELFAGERDLLEKEMRNDEISEAQNLAREWQRMLPNWAEMLEVLTWPVR